MNYEGMGDFEVNRCVAMVLDGVEYDYRGEPKYAVDCFLTDSETSSVTVYWNGNDEPEFVDYCNNPLDSWPIITENHINLSKHKKDDEWFAFTRADDLGVSEFQCKDKNPLKAAMICFLKMKDAEK